MQYLQQTKQQFNNTPQPQWKRVKLPEYIFKTDLQPFNAVEETGIEQAGIYDLKALLNAEQDLSKTPLNQEQLQSYLAIDQGHKESLGDKFTTYVNGYFNHGKLIYIDKRDSAPITIGYQLNELAPVLVDHHLVVVKAGCSLELLLDYRSSETGTFEHYGNLKLIAETGARVKITKLQRLNDHSVSFDQVFTQVAEGAIVTVNDAQIGADIKAFSNIQQLTGYRADATTYSLYYGQPTSKTDVAYTMKHLGKKSTSTILSKGALQNQSNKVFRGNLVFERGATGSVGKEEEFVVLLSEKLKSDSIPGLFCQEDDVIGEHAASVGQVDQNKLFYIMSRGFSETEARKLIIKSSYEEVLQKMAIGDYADQVSQTLDQRIG